jgi:hypothetical protein
LRQGVEGVDANVVTWAIAAIVLFSLLQGIVKGASGSAKRLIVFLLGAIVTVAAIAGSAFAATAVSPRVQTWLAEQSMNRPATDASAFQQFGYTAATGLRDLPLFRFAALFLVFYFVVRIIVSWVGKAAALLPISILNVLPSGGAVSRLMGGAIGAVLGTGRALLLTAVLFAYCALFPQGPLTGTIQQSYLYREAASQFIGPATGALLAEKLPVFAQKMSGELDQLWQKRYDVIDAELPANIAAAAFDVTKGTSGDEAKARVLYDWVGSRITYDNDKVAAYENLGEWREQNPEQTFTTRKGVCIDYSRLYAAMARAVNLDVKVVTGLGYDGNGGYGPHAWNEVYDSEEKRWINLDTTWARTGDWFDRPGFSDTHIRKA